MKSIILVLTFILTLGAFAAVTPYISPDGSKAKIVIQGRDSDAIKLYNLMLVDHVESSSGVLTKEIISPSGQFQLICNISQLVKAASCTAVITQGISSTFMDRENNIAHIEIWGVEGNELFKSFKAYTSEGHYVQFVTERKELVISANKDSFAFDYSLTE